jgi:hypothetical protein
MKPLAIAAALFLSSISLFGSADLAPTFQAPPSPIRSGVSASMLLVVTNNGPDVAPAVTVSISSTIPNTCNCDLGNIPPGQSRAATVFFVAPATAGTITFSATAASGTADPNPANDTATVVVAISSDPDVTVNLIAPTVQDLALPFTVRANVRNFSTTTTAHDVELTIQYRSDVGIKSLPEGCSSPVDGKVVCRIDSLPPATATSATERSFALEFFAPAFFLSGSVTFTAIVTEREHDFDPISNTATQQLLLYKTFSVSSQAESGAGSLRQTILDANQECRGADPCAIIFRINQASPNRWKTINVTSPLPALTASRVRIDGGTQSAFFGDTNPDGPEIEITGSGSTDGDGLLVTNCGVEVANLAINGFLRNGISVAEPLAPCPLKATSLDLPMTFLHHLFIGTDPTGAIARPNARGIGTSFANGTNIGSSRTAAAIQDSVISGNSHSGIFGLSGRLNIVRNRIGVKAHTDDPLPNGNAGVFIGEGGYGSDVGASVLTIGSNPPGTDGNVIAFNGQMGVGVAAGVGDVAIRNNRIWGNALLGIDIGLDGPTQTSAGISMPSLTLAHYDPVSGKTVIEGDVGNSPANSLSVTIDLFANDAPDPSGLGEGQRPLGRVGSNSSFPAHFRFSVDGNLTGQFISATTTRIVYLGFAKPEGIDQAFLTQTSEFSPTIEVR